MQTIFYQANNRRPYCQSGAALVETAMVLPILIILISGLMQIGSALSQIPFLYQITYDAAYLASSSGERSNAFSSDVVKRATALYTKGLPHVFENGNSMVYSNSKDLSKTATLEFQSDFKSLFAPLVGLVVKNRITVAQLVSPPELNKWLTRTN